MNQTFMKERKILPLILSMALPMVISMAVNSLYNIVDSYFVAKISDEAMTALSLVFPIQNMINAIAIGFGVGVNASIAYFLGAEKQEDADTSASFGVLLSLIHGILLTIICILIMPAFLRMFTSDADILDLALTYSRRVFLFSVFVNVGICYEKLFQAVGKMKVSMFSMICGCVTNIILDPLMIFGIGPFPAMGIRGAAYATGIGQCLTLLIYLIILALRPIPVHAHPKYLKWRPSLIGRLYQVGIPATLNTALPSVQVSVLNQILTAFSGQYVLILGIYYKLQTFIYLTANGMVQGIRPLVGYNSGAGEAKRVQQIFRTSDLSDPDHGYYGSRNRPVPDPASADLRPVRPESGRCFHRGKSPPDHQLRIHYIGHLCHLLRCPGRTGKGASIPVDLPVPLYHYYAARSLSFKPACRSNRSLVVLPCHRASDRHPFTHYMEKIWKIRNNTRSNPDVSVRSRYHPHEYP